MPHATILAALGAVQHTAGKHAIAARNLQQAFDEGLGDWPGGADLARWTYWLADSLYWCLDYHGVLDVCTRAFALLPIEPDSLESVLLNQQMAGATLSLRRRRALLHHLAPDGKVHSPPALLRRADLALPPRHRRLPGAQGGGQGLGIHHGAAQPGAGRGQSPGTGQGRVYCGAHLFRNRAFCGGIARGEAGVGPGRKNRRRQRSSISAWAGSPAMP